MAHRHGGEDVEVRNRLPTLLEVLGRRTLAPVDLFSFYIYMRDQQRSVDYLDFWYVSVEVRVKSHLTPSQARRITTHVTM